MKPAELAQARGDLVAFAAEVFAPLARSDQRRWGETYLRGLMLDGRRKSIEPLAARLADGDEQCLQQFVNQSPWEWQPVRERLAARMSAAIAPLAWIVDDTGFPKAGRYSVGVARQYSGTLGKVGNCQIGVSISAASEAASAPLDWRLFLPAAWDEDAPRRAKAHLPAAERHREKWRLALEMLDELREWGLSPPPVVADAGYGEVTAFRTALEERELSYVVEVKAATSAYGQDVLPERPAWRGSGRPPQARYRRPPDSLRSLALAAGVEKVREVAWREGSRGPMSARFLALRVRPANVGLRRAHREALPLAWLHIPTGRRRILQLDLGDRQAVLSRGLGHRGLTLDDAEHECASTLRSPALDVLGGLRHCCHLHDAAHHEHVVLVAWMHRGAG